MNWKLKNKNATKHIQRQESNISNTGRQGNTLLTTPARRGYKRACKIK